MATTYVNPYSFINAKYAAGLDAIIMALPPSPPVPYTLDNLADAIYNYLQATYFMMDTPDALEIQEMKIWTAEAINGYINLGIETAAYLPFSTAQMSFVNQLVNGVLDVRNPEDIEQYILDIEHKLTCSGLNTIEQAPLLYGTAVARAAYNYWKVKGFDPMSSWIGYVTSFTPAINKFPFWVSASAAGALISLNTSKSKTDNELVSAIERVSDDRRGWSILHALTGSMAVVSGKIIFNVQQRANCC
ncbi:MAG TPA: hypothetical protein VK154_20135 [Chitinophagales bacterium]|nr:hypothetical protein [Chitinophagales bacterium]